MTKEIIRRLNLLSGFIFVLLIPMAIGYILISAIEFVLIKIAKLLC